MVERRAGVAGGVGAVQPDQAATVAVEGGANGAGVEDNEIVPEQGGAGEAPAIGDDTVMAQIMFPDDRAFSGVEAEDIAPFAEGEDAVALDGWSGDWTAFMINRAKFRGVGVLPDFFSSQGIEAPDGLLVIGVTHGAGAAFGNGDCGKTGADGSAPKNRGAVCRPMGTEFFRRDAVAICSAPLRPVSCLAVGD